MRGVRGRLDRTKGFVAWVGCAPVSDTSFRGLFLNSRAEDQCLLFWADFGLKPQSKSMNIYLHKLFKLDFY